MEYQEIKKMEMEKAQAFVDMINNSDDKYYVYRTSRPITDLKQMFRTSVEQFGDNVAFRQRFVKGEPFKTITYKEAYKQVNGLGTSLMELGLHGKRIAIIGDTCYQWASSYLAVTGGVGIVVPLDKELGEEELKQLIINSESEAIIYAKRFDEMFRRIKESGDTKLDVLVNMNIDDHFDGVYSWKKLIEEGEAMVEAGDRRYLDAEVIADDMGVLLFTSGTTGIAKGVMLSQTNICIDLMSAPNILNVNTWDIFFSVLPIHHTYCCTCDFLMPLYKGASIAYCEGLKYIQKNLQEVSPTMFLGVPLIFEALYKAIWKNIRKQGKEATVKKVMAISRKTKKIGLDLNKMLLKDIYKVFGGRMRVLISGGAAIDPAILQFFNDLGFVAVQGYGLSECAPIAALNPDQHKWMRNASVGHIMPGMQVKIIDKGEDGVGEICIKGPNVMMGYYQMPEETAKVIQDGWFLTGDLGYTDDEDFIYITGRKKNVIITRNGKNVFPEELEYYLANVDLVEESMVFDEAGDSKDDTIIVAAVKLDAEELKERWPDGISKEDQEKELWKEIEKINESVPFFKRIRKVILRDKPFEKNTANKIKRFAEGNKK